LETIEDQNIINDFKEKINEVKAIEPDFKENK
jgi:hypothetical protein